MSTPLRPFSLSNVTPSDIVCALGGIATDEQAARILADTRARRVLMQAWAHHRPDPAVLERALRSARAGMPGSLQLIEALHVRAGVDGSSLTRDELEEAMRGHMVTIRRVQP